MLTEQDILYFKEKLEAKKKELLNNLNPQRVPNTDVNELADEVDFATVVEQQALIESMMRRDKVILKEVEDALTRIKDEEYGICEGTGEEISRTRLEVQPWCRYTVRHQESLEKLQKKGRGINDESTY